MSDKWLKKYDNIDLSRMDPKILSYLGSLPEELQKEIKVTSANDEKHSKGSYHYQNRAIDLAYNERLYNHIARDPNRHMAKLTLINPNHGTAPHIHLSLANPGGKEFESDVDKEGRKAIFTREGWDVNALNFDSNQQKGSPHAWLTQVTNDLPPLLTDKTPDNIQWLTNIKPVTQPEPYMEYERWNRLGWMDGRIFNDDPVSSNNKKVDKKAAKKVVENLEDSPLKTAMISILDNDDTPRRRRTSSSGGQGGYSSYGNISNQGSSDLRTMLANRESKGSGGYQAQSKNSSAVGKYQFLWDTHGPTIQKVTGVKNKGEFLNNPDAQERYFDYYLENDLNKSFNRFAHDLKRDFPGVSDDKIKAMIHFAGSGNIEKAIRDKSYDKPLDANGASIKSYIGKMNDGGRINTPPNVRQMLVDIPSEPMLTDYDPDAYLNGAVVYASDYPSPVKVDIRNSPLHSGMSEWWGDEYKDNIKENAFEFVDPTGMSAWNDVKRSINKHGLMSAETMSSGLSAVPMFKLGKLTLNLVKDFIKQGGPKALTRAATTTTMYGTLKGHNVKDSVNDVIENVKEDNYSNGGWLNKYK